MLKKYHEKLTKFTKDCRHDMHEPDEQGISAKVIGKELDNAMGEDVRFNDEFVVILKNSKDKEFRINLATLIAIARKARF